MNIDSMDIRETDTQYVIRNRILKKEKNKKKKLEELISQEEKKMPCRAQQKDEEAKVSVGLF